MSPIEALVAGGAAEAFERQLQQLVRGGYRHLIVDLRRVSAIDSAGIRALVRGHTTAQRVGGTMPWRTIRIGVAGAVLCTALVWAGLTWPVELTGPREISQSNDVTVKYFTWLDARASLEDLSGRLMAGGAGVKSVAWEHPKRERP